TVDPIMTVGIGLRREVDPAERADHDARQGLSGPPVADSANDRFARLDMEVKRRRISPVIPGPQSLGSFRPGQDPELRGGQVRSAGLEEHHPLAAEAIQAKSAIFPGLECRWHAQSSRPESFYVDGVIALLAVDPRVQAAIRWLVQGQNLNGRADDGPAL